MNLEDVMLSERSQSQKDKYGRFHSCEARRVVTFPEKESRQELEQEGSRGSGEWEILCLTDVRVSVL